MIFLLSADFFSKSTFAKKTLSGTISECQTILIQIRTDILSVLMGVQTVCKGYQRMTNVAPSKERIKFEIISVIGEDIGDATDQKQGTSKNIKSECFQ